MPINKINKKVKDVKIKETEGVVDKIKGIGISRTISISKTRKITANKKNRVEKGSRALSLGSKPHSKGVDFSRSFILRALSIYDSLITKTTTRIAITEDRVDKIMPDRALCGLSLGQKPNAVASFYPRCWKL